ncbi:MAG: hypothetical protein QM820_09845 [Minicystis sp.]
MPTFFARTRRMLRRSPLESALIVSAIAVTLYVLAAPLAASRYPPMTDLPFHAAQSATLRHYWDPAWHFRDQFDLRPLAAPYVSFYALGALLMLVFPPVPAVKITIAVLLGLVPAGLAVLFHGMKKSPLLGLLGLGIIWGNLTQWGFLNYVGALGLFAMVVGLTLLLLDRPSRRRQIALFLCLVALFFTHIFRYPFAMAAVVGTAIVMYPATRRFRPILAPLLPAIVLFVVWWKIRPSGQTGALGPLTFELSRFKKEYADAITAGFNDPSVRRAILSDFTIGHVVATFGALAAAARLFLRNRRLTAWDVGVTVVALGCAGVFFVLFVVLPLRIGSWWYVYPREAVAGTIILFAACPDLPRVRWLRVSLVALMSLGGITVARHVARNYAPFDASTADFDRITARLPQAPKVLYMIFDHTGTSRSTTPFMHLPAWVQAQKGGWISWHFAVWDQSPIAYRRGQPGAVVTPMTPPRWEWTPEQIKKPEIFARLVPFYDWFLVRQKSPPDALFARDPSIQRVAREGSWWLYRRKR